MQESVNLSEFGLGRLRAFICVCVCVRVRAGMHACVRVRVRVCVRPRRRAFQVTQTTRRSREGSRRTLASS